MVKKCCSYTIPELLNSPRLFVLCASGNVNLHAYIGVYFHSISFKCKSLMCVFSSSGIMELIGIFVGHLYFFLMFKYPQDFGGQRFLSTPSILYGFLVYVITVIRFMCIAYRP